MLSGKLLRAPSEMASVGNFRPYTYSERWVNMRSSGVCMCASAKWAYAAFTSGVNNLIYPHDIKFYRQLYNKLTIFFSNKTKKFKN